MAELQHNHRYPPQVREEDDRYDASLSRYEDFTTTDWIHDSMLDRNRRLKRRREIEVTLQAANGRITWTWLWAKLWPVAYSAQSWFIVTLVGAIIGMNAAVISILTEWLSDLKRGYCAEGWWLSQEFCCWEMDEVDIDGACKAWIHWSEYTFGNWVIYVLMACLFSWLSAHLVYNFARYAAGSGISEIKCILAGVIMKGYLGGWTLIIKSLTLPLIIASGLNVGKEGPSVHVACCIGFVVASVFPRFSQAQSKMREIITASSAAGVAVAFGSPIGGVLFSIEEMSHTFNIKTMWRSFLCALVATVTLSAMNPFRTGKLVLFQVTYDRDWHFFEIVFFVIIGIFGGLYGAFVTKFNLQVSAFRRKHLTSYPITEAVTLATLTAMFSFFNRFLRIDMTESLAILFRECEGGGDYDNLCQTWAQWRMVNSLFIAMVFRIGFVIISYGCKVPAGIFVPSMAVGATFGRMVGIIVKAMYRAYPTAGWFAVCKPDVPCITPGTYAFLGAAAALGGIMRMTLTVVVIMFELTGALTYILPTMIVLLVTKFVGDYIGMEGIADEMIKFNGYPFLHPDSHGLNVPVSRAMHRNLITIEADNVRLEDLERKLNLANVQGYPIVSDDGHNILLGYINRSDIRFHLEREHRYSNLDPNTLCTFCVQSTSQAPLDSRLPPLDDGWVGPSRSPGASAADDEDLELTKPDPSNGISFESHVNLAPITVAPQLSLEAVVQLFKKMGPRVILVEECGVLRGLLTIKDVMRYTAAVERSSSEGSNSLPLGLDNPEVWDEYRGSLRTVLERSWAWTSDKTESLIAWGRHILQR